MRLDPPGLFLVGIKGWCVEINAYGASELFKNGESLRGGATEPFGRKRTPPAL